MYKVCQSALAAVLKTYEAGSKQGGHLQVPTIIQMCRDGGLDQGRGNRVVRGGQ